MSRRGLARYRNNLRSNESSSEIPARVQAALSFLGHCHSKQHTCDAMIPAVGLMPAERVVERHALEVLSLYFSGEMDYGDVPPATRPRQPPDEDRPAQPVLAWSASSPCVAVERPPTAATPERACGGAATERFDLL